MATYDDDVHGINDAAVVEGEEEVGEAACWPRWIDALHLSVVADDDWELDDDDFSNGGDRCFVVSDVVPDVVEAGTWTHRHCYGQSWSD